MSDAATGKFVCPVCGWPEIDEDPSQSTYEICPSCGMEFGAYDNNERWRQHWIDSGMKWWSEYHKPPEDWNPAEQLRRVQ